MDFFFIFIFMSGYSNLGCRDLLKWCKRVDSLGLSFIGNSLSVDECHCICQEVSNLVCRLLFVLVLHFMLMTDH